MSEMSVRLTQLFNELCKHKSLIPRKTHEHEINTLAYNKKI